MKKLDMYWMSNHDWWEWVGMVPTIKKTAPPEAQASYAHYLEQTKDDE